MSAKKRSRGFSNDRCGKSERTFVVWLDGHEDQRIDVSALSSGLAAKMFCQRYDQAHFSEIVKERNVTVFVEGEGKVLEYRVEAWAEPIYHVRFMGGRD